MSCTGQTTIWRNCRTSGDAVDSAVLMIDQDANVVRRADECRACGKPIETSSPMPDVRTDNVRPIDAVGVHESVQLKRRKRCMPDTLTFCGAMIVQRSHRSFMAFAGRATVGADVLQGGFMSDASSAAIRDTRRDWVTEHRDMYLRSGGTQGHIMDITVVGGRSFATHCLIKYKGRKSGKTFIAPLCYGDIGGEVVICASKGGADVHPEWYLNIVASKEIEFQVATQAFRATWREPVGSEREKVWTFMQDCFPFYTTYQASTKRVLPLVMLKAIEPIPVFKESDATGIRQY